MAAIATATTATAPTTAVSPSAKDAKGSSRPRPFKCTECTSSFMQKAHLMLHVKRRHRPRNDWFVCGQCNKRFVFKSELSTHCDRVHGGPKLFKCPTCHKNYARNWILKQHMSSVHGILQETPRVSKRQRELQRIKYERQKSEEAQQSPQAAANAASCGGQFGGGGNAATSPHTSPMTSRQQQPHSAALSPHNGGGGCSSSGGGCHHPSQSPTASSYTMSSPPPQRQQKATALDMAAEVVNAAALSAGGSSAALQRAFLEFHQKQQQADDRQFLLGTNSHPRQQQNEWLAKQYAHATQRSQHEAKQAETQRPSSSQAVDLQQLYNIFAQQQNRPRDPMDTLNAFLKSNQHSPSSSPASSTADSLASLLAAASTTQKYAPTLVRPSPVMPASPSQSEITAMIAGLNLDGAGTQQLLSAIAPYRTHASSGGRSHASPSSGSSPVDVHRSIHAPQHASSTNSMNSHDVKAIAQRDSRRVKCDPLNVEDQKMLNAARALTMASRSPPRAHVTKVERTVGMHSRDMPLVLEQHATSGSDLPHADTVALPSDEDSTMGSSTEDDLLKHDGCEEFTTLPALHPSFSHTQHHGDATGHGSGSGAHGGGGGLDETMAAAIAARAAPPPTSPPPAGDLRATTSSPLFPHHSSSPLTPHLDHLSILTNDTAVHTNGSGSGAGAALHAGSATANTGAACGPRRTTRTATGSAVPVTTLSTTTTTETTVAHHHAHPASAVHHTSHAHQHAAAAAARLQQQAAAAAAGGRTVPTQQEINMLQRQNSKLLAQQYEIKKKIEDMQRSGGSLYRGGIHMDASSLAHLQNMHNMHGGGEASSSSRIPETYHEFLFPAPPPPPMVPATE